MIHKHLFWTIACLLIFGISQAQDMAIECRIIAYTDCDGYCHRLSIFERDEVAYREISGIEPSQDFAFHPFSGDGDEGYTLSPNHQFVAVAEGSIADPFPIEGYVHILILDVSENTFQLDSVVTDQLLAYGNVWSSDSNRLLILSSNGYWQLSMHDLKAQNTRALWPAPPVRTIEAMRVAWSPDDELIAVRGNDYPLVDTEHGRNQVTALWITEMLPDDYSAQYTAISDARINVDQDFTWISDQVIAYTTYVYDRENQRFVDNELVIATVDGASLLATAGNYTIISLLPDDRLLLSFENSLVALDLETYEFHAITSDGNFTDDYALSPNDGYISYVSNGQTVIVNLQDPATQTLTPPFESSGWWHPDERELFFLDYEQQRVYIYALETQSLTDFSASEMFVGQTQLPLHPSWLCTQ